jgi:hypothetical protein
VVLGGGVSVGTAVNTWLGTSNSKVTLCTCGVALGKVTPDSEPETVVTVNKLTTDFDFKLAEKSVGNIGGNACGAKTRWNKKAGVVLTPEVLEEIAVTADCYCNASTCSNRAVDGLLDRLNGEVGVATVYRLEEGNLGLSGKIDILCTVCNKLHESSAHF